MLTTVDNVDLTNCDREPIHVPGSIQSHGCLLACDSSLGTVRRHSVNAAALLGVEHGAINGHSLDELIGGQAAHDIGNAIAKWGNLPRPGLLLGVKLAHSPLVFNVAAHRHQGVNIIEFEPVDAVGSDAATGTGATADRPHRAVPDRSKSCSSTAPRLLRGGARLRSRDGLSVCP